MGKLVGRIAIVTGASRGIGEEIAKLFASEGAAVVCAARTLNEGDHRMLSGSLTGTVAQITRAGGRAVAVAADVSSITECERLVQAAGTAFGTPDILVNNAALTYYRNIVDYNPKHWAKAFEVNVHAPFNLSRLVLPGMIGLGRGAIVNISSGSAIGPGRAPFEGARPVGGGTMYGATKAALERFTQGLAQEVHTHGIAVTAVSPSVVVATPGTVYHKLVKAIDDPNSEPPAYMARAALLLASEPAEKVNGRVTYSQQILGEYGLIDKPTGRGVTSKGSGYSQI
ncbi:MAG: SDR family oxidoreductase [Hyphomicrobiaceae bacterium]|nr:SDR family oxidoreductase [Hyphomicrobiaceae bacterium]